MTIEHVKTVVDVGSGTLTIAALLAIIPSVTAILSLVWIIIRLLETDTVRGAVNKWKARNGQRKPPNE